MKRIAAGGVIGIVIAALIASISCHWLTFGNAAAADSGPVLPPSIDTFVTKELPSPSPRGGSEVTHLAAKPVVPISVPRAEVVEHEFDFGIVEPLRPQRHAFEIHNAGNARLVLTSRGASCKCLKVESIDKTIEPGETGHVVVAWEALPTQDMFVQRVTIATNDPASDSFQLKLMGRARMILAAEPAELVAPRIKPNETTQLEANIISQTWESFAIDDVRPSLAGVDWRLSPIEASDLTRLAAKSGWRLTVTLPAGLPEGALNERIILVARPMVDPSLADDRAFQPVEREIPLEGKVIRRLAVYGKDINTAGTIEAGSINASQGYSAEFTLKVYDDVPELHVASVTTNPAFISARVEPIAKNDSLGLYRLTVKIPPSDIAASYHGKSRGKLTVKFDHPRIKSLELGVDFIILGSVRKSVAEAALPANEP